MRPAAARLFGRRAVGPVGPRISGLSISGGAGVGETLTATEPDVVGDGPFTVAWQWRRSGAAIAGASGTTAAPGPYTQVVADAVANAALPRKALTLAYTVTDANGRSRTVVSNAIAGPALAADDAASVSADGPAATGNVLTNDPTGSATVTAVTVGAQSVTVGVATALTGGGTLTVESTGAWTFDPDGDFGSIIIGQTEAVVVAITRSDGGTQVLTITVIGAAERAYLADPANIASAANPETWTWTGGEGITVLEAGGEFPAAITAGDLGFRRAVLDGVASWNYAYTEAPPLAAVGLYVAMAASGATGEIAAALSAGGAGLVLDYTGGNLRATLTDDAAFSASVSVAMPASGSFMVGVTVNTAAGILGISVTTGASSAAVAVTTSIAGYSPVALATLRFGRFAGLCYYGELLSPAFVSAARLQSDLAHASRAGVYHNAAPAYTAPGSLSLAAGEAGATLDVSAGASGGTAPYTWSIGAVTGDWSGVSINASTGVITADTAALEADGSAGATVTVTDARGLSASDTISVTVVADLIPGLWDGRDGFYYDVADTSTLWQDLAGTVPVTAHGQSVLRVDDLSGNGNHLLFFAAATYQTDGTHHWLLFDGVNDYAQINDRFGLAANPALTVGMGLRILSDHGNATLNYINMLWLIGAEQSAGGSHTLGGAWDGNGVNRFSWRHEGGNRGFPGVGLNTDAVAVWKRAAGEQYGQQDFCLNGADQTAVSAGNPTSVPTNTTARFTVGRYATGLGTEYAEMRLYAAIGVAGYEAAGADLDAINARLADRAGVTL